MNEKYECSFCGKAFLSKEVRILHERKVHDKNGY